MMLRMKIKDLPMDEKVCSEEMRKILGGSVKIGTWPTPEMSRVLKYSRPCFIFIDTVPLPE
jgi:hypothetical protein